MTIPVAINIRDVAQRAGVSKATVSRVLNGHFGEMSAETRARVEQVIQEMQYIPARPAYRSKARRTQLLGLLVAGHGGTDIALGAADACRRMGYSLLTAGGGGSADAGREALEALRSRQVEGMIVAPGAVDRGELGTLVDEHHPLVFLDCKSVPGPADLVKVDHFLGAYMAVEWLMVQGHRRIGIVLPGSAERHGEARSARHAERLAGYRAALERRPIPRTRDLIRTVGHGDETVSAAIAALLSLPDPPTAILSGDGAYHVEVLSAIRCRGLQVPRDVSLLGLDDPEWAGVTDPPLSAVSLPMRELGEAAVLRLVEHLKKPGDWRPTLTLLDPRLVVRGSAAPCRER